MRSVTIDLLSFEHLRWKFVEWENEEPLSFVNTKWMPWSIQKSFVREERQKTKTDQKSSRQLIGRLRQLGQGIRLEFDRIRSAQRKIDEKSNQIFTSIRLKIQLFLVFIQSREIQRDKRWCRRSASVQSWNRNTSCRNTSSNESTWNDALQIDLLREWADQLRNLILISIGQELNERMTDRSTWLGSNINRCQMPFGDAISCVTNVNDQFERILRISTRGQINFQPGYRWKGNQRSFGRFSWPN